MQTVAVLSLKGGVGKTTVVLGLASSAMRRGARTLVVDLDPQCNATVTLDPEETDTTLADVLENPRLPVLREAIRPSGWGDDVDVLVGSEDLEGLNDPHRRCAHAGNLGRALEAVGHLIRGRRPALPAGAARLPAVAGQADPLRAGRRAGRADWSRSRRCTR